MGDPAKPSSSAFAGYVRRLSTAIGFSKTYNLFFYLFFGGALLGFVLARFMFINIDNVFCGPGFSPTSRASPGECYYYRSGLYRAGMLLHLACFLPAGCLVVFQFLPVVRHKFIPAHRINGYIILLLSVAGTAGALIITRRAFGGGLDVQTGFGMIAIMFLTSLLIAYINIKRLRIDQHRAWMLRAWFYASILLLQSVCVVLMCKQAGAIITVRPILFITALIISKQDTYYEAIPCRLVQFLNSTGQFNDTFPPCSTPDSWTAVRADLNDNTTPLGPAASLRAGFGMAGWLALFLHAIGVEIYVSSIPSQHLLSLAESLTMTLEAPSHPCQE